MSDQFVAEIRMFACNFAPTGWALCNGQLLPISQNTALFYLLGTSYGGDGKSTFALPDLQGMVPMAWGDGPGLSSRVVGESGGSDMISLLESEIPSHNHGFSVSQGDATDQAPANSKLASGIGIGQYANAGALTMLSPNMLAPAGGQQPHNNLMPFLTLTFCIALQGVFPPR